MSGCLEHHICVCCDFNPWDHEELDMAWQLSNNRLSIVSIARGLSGSAQCGEVGKLGVREPAVVWEPEGWVPAFLLFALYTLPVPLCPTRSGPLSRLSDLAIGANPWRRLLRAPWTASRSNKSILKKISPEYSLEGLMLKLKLQYFGYLMGRN